MRKIEGKNVLVTGGAGFIGSHICDELLAKGAAKVVCVDNFFLGKEENIKEAMQNKSFKLYKDDARNFGTMLAILEKENIEIIYNMATIPLNYSFFNPFDAYMVNVKIMNTILQLQKIGKFKTLIHSSSSEAYGTAQYSPMDENHPINPTTPYAAGKAAADLMAQTFYKVLGLDISIIRPFNNYGPRQNAEGPLAGIIPATAKRIKDGLKPIIEGTGEQTRDFIFVKDTVSAFIMAYENEEAQGKIINLGLGKSISIKKILQEICNYMNYSGEWEQLPERKSDVKNLCASAKLAKEILNFDPRYEFERGLSITLEWYLRE